MWNKQILKNFKKKESDEFAMRIPDQRSNLITVVFCHSIIDMYH
jgi:hypothetical protein